MTVRTWTVYQGIQRSIRKISAFTTLWRTIKFGYTFKDGAWRLIYKQRLELTLTTPQVDFNLKTWAISQGWDGTSVIDLVVTANTTFDASGTGTFAFVKGTSWPVGSLFTLNGIFTVRGHGGAGGPAGPPDSEAPGANGQSGGPAMSMSDATGLSVTIDFTQGGFIGGGGGGGSGGGTVAGQDSFGEIVGYSQGSAGGNGAGPSAATASPGPSPPHMGGHPDQGVFGGSGGNGGDFGQPGTHGTDAHVDDGRLLPGFQNGTAGTAGKAIELAGSTITLIGNNGSNLRGVVS